jgi:DNA-binding NarL/FixJ family response regulator
MSGWIANCAVQPVSRSPDLELTAEHGDAGLRLILLGRSGFGEILARVSTNAPAARLLSRKLGLSLREAEILTWLARGKANKDIAAIL